MTQKAVSDYLSASEILAQSRGSCRTGQEALKLRRALDGTNPTPKSIEECKAALCEEYADVIVCANVLHEKDPELFMGISSVTNRKLDRWITRLREAHHEESV